VGFFRLPIIGAGMVSEFVPENESIQASIEVRELKGLDKGVLYTTENRAIYKNDNKLLDFDLSEVAEVEVRKNEMHKLVDWIAGGSMILGSMGALGGLIMDISEITLVGFGVLILGFVAVVIGYLFRGYELDIRTAVNSHSFYSRDEDGIMSLIASIRQ
jgi:hypothetical protein